MAVSVLIPWALCLILTGALAVVWVRRERVRRTEQRAHAETREILHRMHQALESASDAIGIGDMESNSLYHNRAHRELFGYTTDELNACEEPAVLFADKTVAAEIHACIRSGQSWRGETEIKTRSGRVLPAFVRADLIRNERGEPIGIFGVFTDITERRAAERALAEERERSARAQRLESLGLLAGGVAHDFGNLLAIILGYTSFLKETPGLPGKAPDHVRTVEDAALRARDLSHNLLRFARGSTPEPRRLPLAPILTAAAKGAVATTAVRLDLAIEDNLVEVNIDPVQIDQVFSNLAVNAVQAMAEGGVLSVAARNADRGARGRWVEVTVADTGCGIPPEQLARIWEPFFTTKHKGTGLGLATTFNVIKNHGGMIEARSQPGLGTTFSVALPAAREAGRSGV